MKRIPQISTLMLILILMTSFTNCSTAQKLQQEAPMEFGDSYFQQWVAGIKGGGSGLNLFIPIIENKNNVVLDSVYFRGKATKLEKISGENVQYAGYFKTPHNNDKEIILSSDMNEEHKNTISVQTYSIPFDLKDDECVVTYKINEKTKYFKISNIKEKQPLHYPSAPPNKN